VRGLSVLGDTSPGFPNQGRDDRKLKKNHPDKTASTIAQKSGSQAAAIPDRRGPPERFRKIS